MINVKLTQEQKNMLRVEKPGARYNLFYQAHPHLKYENFYTTTPEGDFVESGILEVLGITKKPEVDSTEKQRLIEFLDIIKPFELYDFQTNAIIDALNYKKLFIRAATGSGKSVIIAMLAKILDTAKLKGLILVPNISLVNQFGADLDSYNCNIQYKLIGGEFTNKELSEHLTISTWQSLQRNKTIMREIDYLIIDEAHQAKANEIYNLAKNAVNAKYIIGLTGTIPQDHYSFLKICSIFGVPKSYVSPRELINAGLGTNININIHNLQHQNISFNDYQKALSYIIKSQERNYYIVNLVKSLKGNTLVLSNRNEHLYRLFRMLMPCQTNEKSYKDLNLQIAHNVFFINGSIEGEQREIIRNALEVKQNATLISNYSVLSTGVNIRNLHNLVFAAPQKSYISITQSLGRLIRIHESKTEVQVYDLTDNIGFFIRQKLDRIKDCYKPQGYKISEKIINL